MIIILEIIYSLESSEELAKRISELPPLPSCISLKGPYARFISKNRIKSISIYEFDELEFFNVFKYITKRVSACESVAGFSYNTRIWYEEEKLQGL